MFGIDDAAIAAVLGGIISTAGSLYTNKKNRDAAAEANAINWEIAKQNNATQIEMANTAHQREVRDLRAAGLNPILSASGNGSAVPSLQAPNISPVRQDNAFEGLANSARGLSRYMGQMYRAELASQQASADQAINDAEISKQQAYQSSWESSNARARARLEAQELSLHNRALEDLTTKFEKQGGVWRQTFDPDSKYYKNYKDALAAEAGLGADARVRGWMSSLVPFTSPAAVNSAASAVRGPRPINNTRTINIYRRW